MNKYGSDIYRYYGKNKLSVRDKINEETGLKYILLYRRINNTKSFFRRIILKLKLRMLQNKYNIVISEKVKIGKGLYLGHARNIVINPDTIIGDNCNIQNGVVIGQENRGKRKGTPRIGNEVWIGANAVIVGSICIGDDVLIAPVSFVNFDVPSLQL